MQPVRIKVCSLHRDRRCLIDAEGPPEQWRDISLEGLENVGRNSDFGVTGNFSSVLELGINDPVGGRLRGEHVCAPDSDSALIVTTHCFLYMLVFFPPESIIPG